MTQRHLSSFGFVILYSVYSLIKYCASQFKLHKRILRCSLHIHRISGFLLKDRLHKTGTWSCESLLTCCICFISCLPQLTSVGQSKRMGCQTQPSPKTSGYKSKSPTGPCSRHTPWTQTDQKASAWTSSQKALKYLEIFMFVYQKKRQKKRITETMLHCPHHSCR